MASRKAGDAFRNNLEERIGTNEYDRIGAAGQQDATNQGKYSAKEVISEFRNRGKGVSIDEGDDSMVSKYQGLVDDGTTFNKRARDYLKGHGVQFGGNGESPEDVPEATPDPVTTAPIENDTDSSPVTINPYPVSGGGSSSSQTQTVVQDNDQTSNVTGNNNTVTQNQDNSVSQNGFVSANSAKASGLKDSYILNLLNRKGY